MHQYEDQRDLGDPEVREQAYNEEMMPALKKNCTRDYEHQPLEGARRMRAADRCMRTFANRACTAKEQAFPQYRDEHDIYRNQTDDRPGEVDGMDNGGAKANDDK